MRLFYTTADVYRYDGQPSDGALGNGWRLVIEAVPCAENYGTGVGVNRSDTEPDVERNTMHYFQGTPAVEFGDLFTCQGGLYRMGSPYNCRGHHVEVTTEKVGDMATARYRRRVRDYYGTPTPDLEGEWEVRGVLGSKRSKEEVVSGTGKSIKPIKTLTVLSLPDGMDAPATDDVLTIDGRDYTVTQVNEAVMNADPGLWTLTLVEGAI